VRANRHGSDGERVSAKPKFRILNRRALLGDLHRFLSIYEQTWLRRSVIQFEILMKSASLPSIVFVIQWRTFPPHFYWAPFVIIGNWQ
jgi:hypothetical protein